MAASVGSNGTLTADQVQRFLVQPLTQASTFLRLNTPMFVSNGEPIKVPTLTSMGTPTYIAEGSAISDVSPVTSEVELLSSSVYSIKVLAKVSNELVRQSVVNVEAAFSQKLVSDVTRVLDSALWAGSTATTGSPIGLFSMTGFTNAGTVAGTALASGDLFDMEADYLTASADEASAVWALSPTNFTRIRKMTDNYGARVLQPSLAEGAPGTLLGKPYVVSTHIPDTAIALFDRNQIAVGMDSRASITVLDQTFADYDQTAYRVTARYDVKPLNAAAIVRLAIS